MTTRISRIQQRKNNTTFSSTPFINRYSLSITKLVDQLSTPRGDDVSILTRLKLLISQILLHRIPQLTRFFSCRNFVIYCCFHHPSPCPVYISFTQIASIFQPTPRSLSAIISCQFFVCFLILCMFFFFLRTATERPRR